MIAQGTAGDASIADPSGEARPTIRDAAQSLVASGCSIVPMTRHGSAKRPRLKSWAPLRKRLPTHHEIDEWFLGGSDSMAIVCGAVSGGVEVIDFDCAGEAFSKWWTRVVSEESELEHRLVVQSTPSGGYHVIYRTTSVAPSMKLARKLLPTDEPRVPAFGKEHRTIETRDGARQAIVTLIETRGEGGLALCWPSPGYQLRQGRLESMPVLSEAERDTLLAIAREFDEGEPDTRGFRPVTPPVSRDRFDLSRPGDDYNQRGDLRELLIEHSWTRLRDGPNEHWCRPGKSHGTSATFNGRHFYVFSTNAHPLEANRAYSPFALFAALEHGGDYSQAARALRDRGFGDSTGTRPLEMAERGPLREAFEVITAPELMSRSTELREPVVEGLLRIGEVANLVAAPKSGKSWAAMDLAVAAATGRRFLGHFDTRRNRVLLVDNELHEATLSARLKAVLAAKGVSPEDCGPFLNMVCAREHRRHARPLEAVSEAIRRSRPRLVLLDAWYRFLPGDMDENDNLRVAGVYDDLNEITRAHGCAIVVVHHTSKGDQWSKSVSDIGAGAGSQSRACDAHITLRPLREDGTAALHAIVRSWPPVPPIGLRFRFPQWFADPTVNPMPTTGRGSSRPVRADARITKEEFVERFVTDVPTGRSELRQRANAEGISMRHCNDLIGAAQAAGLIHVWKTASNQEHRFATVPQPAVE